MGERLTWEEIERKYPEEWVLLVDLDADDYINVRSAVVLLHGDDAEELERRAAALRLKDNAILHTGDPLNPEIAYAL